MADPSQPHVSAHTPRRHLRRQARVDLFLRHRCRDRRVARASACTCSPSRQAAGRKRICTRATRPAIYVLDGEAVALYGDGCSIRPSPKRETCSTSRQECRISRSILATSPYRPSSPARTHNEQESVVLLARARALRRRGHCPVDVRTTGFVVAQRLLLRPAAGRVPRQVSAARCADIRHASPHTRPLRCWIIMYVS